MAFLILKVLHILSAIVLFGVGLGSVFYKVMADRSRNVAAIAVTSRNLVLADWFFTSPTVIFQLLSGLMMAAQLNLPWDTDWLVSAYILYGVAGLCWLPVVGLQIALQNIANQAFTQGNPLPERYWFLTRVWMALGVPAFLAMIALVAIMVFHVAFWS